MSVNFDILQKPPNRNIGYQINPCDIDRVVITAIPATCLADHNLVGNICLFDIAGSVALVS